MIVLDTHAWLWWIGSPEKLSRFAAASIEEADRLAVCTVSCFEVATLSRRGRISLDRPLAAWISQALARDGIDVLPLTSHAAIEAGSLPDEFPGDPADRVIYATARANGSLLATKDEALLKFDPERTVW